MFEFSLEFFELSVYSFVVSCVGLVEFFELQIFFFILFSEVEVSVVKNRLLFLELFMIFMIFFFFFFKDLEIVVQFLGIQLVEGFHLLIALF